MTRSVPEAPTRRKKFLFDEPIELPLDLSVHSIDGRYLIIAPQKGNWITTDRPGLDFVQLLHQGLTLRQTLDALASQEGTSFDEALDRVSPTLRAIEANQFYERPERDLSDVFTGYGLHLYASMRCNLRCIHCYIEGGDPLLNELRTPEILAVLDACVQCGFRRFSLSGGEPLCHPDWVAILEHANAVGLSCSLLTNATLIGDAETARVIAALTDEVQVSLDGATEAVNDAIRGPGSYRRALRGLDLLIAAGARVYIAMTAMPQNIQDLEAHVVALAERLGPDRVTFRIARLERRGRARDLAELSDLELEQASKRILQQLVGPELWAERYSLPRRRAVNCGYGPGVTLSADGGVHLCAAAHRPVGNVRQTPFAALHERVLAEHRRTAVDHIPLCADCDLRYICAGGCRIHNETVTGNMLQPACDERRRQAYYVRLSAT